MEIYSAENIRNIVLLGHGGVGKTTIAEQMAFMSKATTRVGTVADKNTISDFDPEETKRGFSINTSLIPIEWSSSFIGHKINVLDTPGYLDFSGEVLEGVRVADAAVITIDGKAGLEVIVGNDGAAPVEHMTVEIYRCTSDGTEIGQALTRKTFENVPGGSYRQLQLDQTESHQMYKVVVLSGDQQTDSHMLLWKDETARCLWVSDVDVRKNGDAKVTLYAQNQEQDLSLMLALYQDEQMVACGMEADLDTWEGNKQVSLELDKLSAGDYTCMVYLLEQDTLIPVSEPYTFDLTF